MLYHPMNARIDELFLEALQIPAGAEQDAFLDEACKDNAGMRRRLETMLADDTAADAFFDGPATVSAPSPRSFIHGEKPGEMIGRYKLLQVIGEGGFGTVWMAEQNEPVQRRVALKIIRIGMDTREFIARFEQEQQALAMMDHPNIARVLDGGATPGGRPYFVMELVHGAPITTFCDEQKLPLAARLELFIEVCHAIQHAHQKGVIHRDIKPSNVMVTLDGDKAVPKVIDFGIAKATQGKITDKTVFTRFEQFIGTPVYMSPEQAGLGGLDIDTRCDIYALGILLYELLTGKPPFDAKSLVSAGYEEMRRIIREVEPPKPSSKLSTVVGDERTTLANAMHIEPGKLSRMVEPDLDWIVMMAIEKDRTRRYETVNGLARDIQRFLANEPVSATPPSASYKFRKFARRNKAALRAAAGIAALLVAGVVLITSQWRRAERNARDEGTQRERAEKEVKHAEAAEREMREALRNSQLTEARALRVSGQAGRRFQSLDVLAKAAAIRPGVDLRDEAIAAMSLADIRQVKTWQVKKRAEYIAFDESLDRYASVDANGHIIIRQTKDDRELTRLPASAGEGARGVPVFSPDGKWLAVRLKGGLTQLWDTQRAEVFWTLPPHHWLDFTPDSRQLALRESAGRVAIYNLADKRKVSEFTFKTSFDAAGDWFASFHPSGRKLALVNGKAPEVKVFNVESGELVLTIPQSCFSLSWHPGGRYLATACKDDHIYVWDTVTGQVIKTLTGHEGAVVSVRFSHSGELLASSAWDGTVRLWRFPSGAALATVAGGGPLQFSTDDRHLGAALSWENDTLALFEVASGHELRVIHGEKGVDVTTGVEFSSDGAALACRNSGRLFLCDPRSGQRLAINSGGNAWCFADPAGAGFYLDRSGSLLRWPLLRSVEGDTFETGPEELLHSLPGFQWMCISPDGKFFLVRHGGSCQVIEARTWRGRGLMKAGPLSMRFVTLSPDGRWVAAGPWNGTVVSIWEANTGDLAHQIALPGMANVAFSPDGTGLLVGGIDFQFLEVGSWTCRWRLDRAIGETYPTPISFSKTGDIVALCDTWKTVKLVRSTTGEQLASFETGNLSLIDSMCLSPDATRLAVALRNGQFHIWDLRRIRAQLAAMNLDWDMPAFPPETPAFTAGPLRVIVALDLPTDVAALAVTPDIPKLDTLVAPDAGWKWLHPTDGKDPAEKVTDFHPSFFLPDFNDSAWQTGQDSDEPAGGFGYGGGFTGVDIEMPENEAHRHTAYFRHTFATDKAHTNLELRCLRNDGVIVYLDGREVIRDNVAPGADAYLLHASEPINPKDDGLVHRFAIQGTLAPGPHILAISVHNSPKPGSTDLRLGGVTLVEVEAPKK